MQKSHGQVWLENAELSFALKLWRHLYTLTDPVPILEHLLHYNLYVPFKEFRIKILSARLLSIIMVF